jgi:outer membrane protein OmpA-like peptidoglycan-associated protein
MKIYYYLLLYIFLIIPAKNIASADADSTEIFAIQPRIGINYNFYIADFNGYQGTVDCGHFTSGFGWGIPLGVSFEKYFTVSTYGELGLFYNFGKGFLTQSISFPIRDLNNGNIVDVQTSNQLNMNISFLELNPSVGYDIFKKDDYSTRLSGGLNFSIPIHKTFDQKEVLSSPSNAYFVNSNNNHVKERPLASGTITTMNSLLIAPQVAIEAVTKSYGTFHFSISYLLNNYTSDVNWKSFAVRYEYGYRFSIKEAKKEAPKIIEVQPEPIPVIVEPKPSITLKNLHIVGQIEFGNELLASLPIVNSVFFQNGSSEIPAQYRTRELPVSNFSGDAVKIHDYLLPRIAEIVAKNPNAIVTLQSATSGQINEPTGLELSKARANTVKDYLINLGVPKNKIKEEALLTPKNPSNQDFKEGVAENQRVDIILTNAPLQEYVDLQKYANFKGKLIFDADVKNFKNEKVEIENNLNNQKILINHTGTYEIPLNYRLPDNFVQDTAKISFNFKGQEQHSEKIIQYNDFPKQQVDLNLDNFLAILRFDYNSSKISDENQELLKQLVAKLPADATIEILGSTDELGTQQRNAILARERAENTMNFIKSISGNKLNIIIGTNNDKFPEDTPQGRFLNRSIRIKVKK